MASLDFDTRVSSLTDRQFDMYVAIRDFEREHGFAPTVREIGEIMGIASPNGVLCHVRAIQKKGLIVREYATSRSIRVLHNPAFCPTCGRDRKSVV